MQRLPKAPFHSLTVRPGFLRLHPLPALAEEKESSCALLRCQQHNGFQAAAMEFFPAADGEKASLLLTQNERFSFLLIKERADGINRITCCQIINGKMCALASVPVPDGRLYLFLEGREGAYSFFYGLSERDMRPLDADASFLSTLVVLSGKWGAFHFRWII